METQDVRIGFVAPLVTAIAEPQLGGSQAILADLASGLTARGYEVDVFAASGSHIDGANVVDTGIDPSMLEATFFRASEDVRDFDIARDAFAHVYGLVRARAYDVVHNHAFDVPAIDLVPDDVTVVHTLHLPPAAAIADALSRARGRNPRVTAACVSVHAAVTWGELTEVDVVLRDGVPVDRIPWSSGGGDGLLFAGRFSPEKGAAEAIEIALGAGVPITVVGDPYDTSYTRERIDPFRGRDGVTVVRALPRSDLWSVMASSRAVLCPIRWDEPFGLVGAEAQAAGTPVIAFDRGAMREVIDDGRTGRLVGDVAAAIEAVRTITDIDRAACREHAERNLSLATTLDAHEALYASVAQVSTGAV
jgi:glycosyltransferase involved in cell wall biosynthesis